MRLNIGFCVLSVVGFLAYGSAAAAQVNPATEPTPVAPATGETTTTTVTTEAGATGAVTASGSASVPPQPVSTPLATTTDAAPPTVAPAPTSFVPLKIDSANATIKFGLLAQPQFEVIGNRNPAIGGASYNLFVRRTRLLVGGTLFGKFEYFFDTDAPNLFRATDAPGAGTGTGEKTNRGIGVQDVLVTYKAYEDYFKIDAGYMLVPGSHNALQGAGTLYGLDYFQNTFRHASVFNSAGDVGRDTGVEARGLVADGHLEYRLGVFQGYRRPATAEDPVSRNMFRVAGRVQINFLDPETAFFYAGSYLGTKRILSVGAAYDTQNSYHHWAVDGFLDLPLGPGALTAQVNFNKWNGGDLLPPAAMAATGPLPNQTAIVAEAGYRFEAVKLSPILRFERLNIVNGGTDENRYGAGLAFWPYAHNVNLKAFYQRVEPTPNLDGYNQFNLQWQLYFY